MNTCQFRIGLGPTCGNATTGDYCWFHAGIMQGVDNNARVGYQDPTNTVGTSHAYATTNTTPEHAVQQALARTAPVKQPWYRGLVWWKVLIAALVVGVVLYFFWPYVLILVGIVLLGMFLRFLGGMNWNSNTNTNENVNQVTVNPIFNVSPVVNVKVNTDD